MFLLRTDGLMSLLLPAAKQLDESATLVAQSQLRLVSEIDRLNTGMFYTHAIYVRILLNKRYE